MNSMDEFFDNRNTVKGISHYEISQATSYLEPIIAISRATYNSIYVIDYFKQGFDYVSDNPLFLCGNTAEEVQQMGYDFYAKHVPAEDLELLLKINTVGFDFYENIPTEERKDHVISYDFRLNAEGGNTILINQKLTPLFLTKEGKIWKALCIISLSSERSSGNIEIHKKGGNTIYKFDLEGDFWKTEEKISLTDREKEILRFSTRGYTINDIAKHIFVSPDTVKFHRKKLFDKLEVANISEAIFCATNNKLI